MTTPSADVDRLRRAFADLVEHAAPPAGGCPSPDRLWWAARGELPAAESRALVLHTAECPWCAEAWRLALELRSEAHAEKPARLGTRWWGGALPMAAAVTAVALAAGVLLQQDGPARYRAQERGAVRALVAEDRPLPRAACVLRWSSAGEGARYDLRVATTALAVVYSTRNLSATEEQVPASALAALPAGTRLLWQVEAVAADGTRTASATFMARLE